MNLYAIHKIWKLLTPLERRKALVLLGLMFVGMVLETLGIGLMIPAIMLLMQDNLVTRYPVVAPVLAMLGNPSQQLLIIGGTLALVGVYLIKTLFLAFLAWRQTCFIFLVQMQLSQRLFAIYLRQPYTFHLQRNSAQLIHNAINEVGGFANALTQTILLLTESLVLLGVSSLLLVVEPLNTVIVALVLGGAAWGFYRSIRTQITRWGEARHHHEGLRMQHLQQGLGGAKDVKLLGREDDFLMQYSIHTNQSSRAGQFQTTLQQLPRLWLELLAIVGMTLLVLSMLAQGQNTVEIIPTLGLFAIAAFRLMPSINRILGAVQVLRYNLSVINTLYNELQFNIPELITQKSVDSPSFERDIRLVNINYAYPGVVKSVLNDISIIIKKGESIGFIGLSGAGKSTLVDIILGLLPPCRGKVIVDGQDIQQNLRRWQDQIGYVPQSIYLTDDTLRRNIAFGLSNKQINDIAVSHAIRAAQLEEFVASLPDGLETLVGERGIRLSGGQRQRIGIARALYHDPVVLVLDEATSSLDTATEHGVMQAVLTLRGSKTILIVAHRMSTVEHCDRLYCLEQGRVIAEGAAEEVLANKKIVSA